MGHIIIGTLALWSICCVLGFCFFMLDAAPKQSSLYRIFNGLDG